MPPQATNQHRIQFFRIHQPRKQHLIPFRYYERYRAVTQVRTLLYRILAYPDGHGNEDAHHLQYVARLPIEHFLK